MEEKRLLAVGLVCLDIINICEKFPHEDEDMRANSQCWQSGGNAANFLKVLSQCKGRKCDLFGSISVGVEVEFVLNDLRQRGIGTGSCIVHDGCGFPTSCVINSLATGSRTIVHSRNGLPEITAEDFEKIELSKFSWIHFEGRNPSETFKMIKRVEAFNALRPEDELIVISVEVEKKKVELMPLLSLADVVFISKDFAKFHGYTNPVDALEHLHPKIKKAGILICAWGEEGATGVGGDKILIHSNAFIPDKVIDTLGAGDTFIAGVVHSLHQNSTLEEALSFGCKLAGKKCGMVGFDNIVV